VLIASRNHLAAVDVVCLQLQQELSACATSALAAAQMQQEQQLQAARQEQEGMVQQTKQELDTLTQQLKEQVRQFMVVVAQALERFGS
jgi:F0F1-type ATP synthase membrane subunit b/b'